MKIICWEIYSIMFPHQYYLNDPLVGKHAPDLQDDSLFFLHSSTDIHLIFTGKSLRTQQTSHFHSFKSFLLANFFLWPR